MQHYSRWIIVVAIAVAILPVSGCDKPSTSAKANAATVKKPEEPGPKRITLTDTEAKNLGIAFVEVTQEGAQLVAPYNTLLYDATGKEWVFISPEPNVFMRAEIKVEKIEDEKVFLVQGPAAGTKLVTDGAAELYGIEFGVGK